VTGRKKKNKPYNYTLTLYRGIPFELNLERKKGRKYLHFQVYIAKTMADFSMIRIDKTMWNITVLFF